MSGGKVAVLGAGSWGTALAILLEKKGYDVGLWGRRPDIIQEIKMSNENHHYLPGVIIPERVKVTVDMVEAVHGAKTVVCAVPSHVFREVIRMLLPSLEPEAMVVNAAKGLEEESLMRLSQVFAQEAGSSGLERFIVLSGPSHAEEVSRNVPTTVVVAAKKLEVAEYAQDLLMTPTFRVYTNPDVIGVELGGALKNIIALGAGIAEGLGFGDNTKAALMTRGLAEITRLGVALGSHPLTFSGLAGIGDLIVTCTSVHSRNRRAGLEIGRGKSPVEAISSVKMVVEGVKTTHAAYQLANKYGVEMPITEQMYKVLFERMSPQLAVNNLMTRGRTREMEEVARNLKRGQEPGARIQESEVRSQNKNITGEI